MKIERIDILHADGAWRNFDFVKVTADTGVVGWSEYNESFGGRGVTALIEEFAGLLIGKDAKLIALATWLSPVNYPRLLRPFMKNAVELAE